MKNTELTHTIIACACKVHSQLGPGLFESTYEICLTHELKEIGCNVECQKQLPIVYRGLKLESAYRIDLLVNDSVIIELKSVKEILPLHTAQLLTYMKLSKMQTGLLFNFNVLSMKAGIKRISL